MALSLRSIEKTPIPVEVHGIVPDQLQGRSLAEIERMEIAHGNRSVALGELFKASGNPADGRIDFEGDLSGVHRIGYGMRTGTIHVDGDAGRHLGATMSGGTIRVVGNAGDFAGVEMSGGKIEVSGSVGHLVGAAYPGGKQGMRDGSILIGGDAGDELGAFARRGTIAVAGACGNAAGFNMIAGTILVFGSCGARPGAAMRRGTIGLFGTVPPCLPPTFRAAGRFKPLFLRLLFGELARLRFPIDHGLLATDLSLWHGDLVALGKGEVLMRTI